VNESPWKKMRLRSVAGISHSHAVTLAELLLSTAPWQGGRVFFSDNGSTAVEVALKMAYQYWCHQGEPRRTWFVGFEGGYHGDSFGAMSVGRDPVFFGRFEPLLFRARPRRREGPGRGADGDTRRTPLYGLTRCDSDAPDHGRGAQRLVRRRPGALALDLLSLRSKGANYEAERPRRW